MRILHFIHNFPPEFRGGTESYLLNLALRQIRTGHQVRVVSGSAVEDADLDSRKECMGPVQVTRLFTRSDEGFHTLQPHSPRITALAKEMLRHFKPHIVHVHHWHGLTDDLVRAAREAGIPVVLTLHDFYAVCPKFFRAKPGAKEICPTGQSPGECYSCFQDDRVPRPLDLAKALYERRTCFHDEVTAASYVYTFSRVVADFYRDIPWFPHLPIGIFPIGLLRTLPQAAPRDCDLPLRIATWGGQTEVKGTHLLLEAAARPGLKGKVEIHVLGRLVDPAYRTRIEALAQACGAVLHGYFPESEKSTLGSRFDLAVFPTQAFETYSIVVDEALSMGMPVISTHPGAQSERVGSAGRVVPAGNVDALTCAIEEMLDPVKRSSAARAARAMRVGTMDSHWMALYRVYFALAMDAARSRRPAFHETRKVFPARAGAGRPHFEPRRKNQARS